MAPTPAQTTGNSVKPTSSAAGTPNSIASAQSSRPVRGMGDQRRMKALTTRETLMETVKTPEDALLKLIEMGYLTPDTDITFEKISLLMMQLSTQMMATNVNDSVVMLKALALLVEDVAKCETANDMVAGVIGVLTGEEVVQATANAITNEMWQTMQDLKGLKDDLVEWQNAGGVHANMQGFQEELTAEMRGAVQKIAEEAQLELKAVSEKAAQEAQKAAESMAKVIEGAAAVAATVNEMKMALEAAQESADKVSRVDSAHPVTPPALWHTASMARAAAGVEATLAAPIVNGTEGTVVTMTYAEAIKAKRTLTQRQALEKARADGAKIMFQSAEGAGCKNGLELLSPAVLVAKADAALELMKTNGEEIPEGIAFRGAKTLPGGNVVYTLNSPEAGKWVRDKRVEFLKCFGGQSMMAEAEMPVLLENVPVTFCVTEKSLRGLEASNALLRMALAGARWIKPVARRTEGQRSAHLILNFADPKSANIALRQGIFIMGTRSHTRKMVNEPPKCFKCQKAWVRLEHLASKCPNKEMVCALCGKAHHVNTCELNGVEPVHHYCVNCKKFGHGSNDKLCPTYLKLLLELNRRNPGNLFKYYVVDDDEDTMELLHPDAAEYSNGRGHLYRQERASEWTPANGWPNKQYQYGLGGGGETTAHQGAGWADHRELSLKEIAAKKPEDRTEEEQDALYQADPVNIKAVTDRRKARDELAARLQGLAEGEGRSEWNEGVQEDGELTQRRKRVENAADGQESEDELEYETTQQMNRRTGRPATPPTPTSGQPSRTSTGVDHA